jgi:hypothetical protein
MGHVRNFTIIFGPVWVIFLALFGLDQLAESAGSLAVALPLAAISLALCIAGLTYSLWLLRLVIREGKKG